MKLFAFISERGGGVIGLTVRWDGGNLPASFWPWIKVCDDVWVIGEAEAPRLTEAVQRDGYYIMANDRGALRQTVQVTVRRKKFSQPNRQGRS
jgi:hypothetical protein